MTATSLKDLPNCHDCGAKPGEQHSRGCDVQRCSVCGGQRMCCSCEGHDPEFAKWKGTFPGTVEAKFFGMDLNSFYCSELYSLFYIKNAHVA